MNAISVPLGAVSRAICVGVVLSAAGSARAWPDLYNNGPFVSHPGAGAGGANLSMVQTASLQNNSFGATIQWSPGNDRVADDFVLAAGATLTSVVIHCFQSNSPTTPTITGVNLRIWTGRPDDPGSQVIFGNTTTNRMTGAQWTGCYRARDSSPLNVQYPIMAVEAAISPPLVLPAGTYWLDWQASGSLSGGPLAALVTVAGQPGVPNANSRHKLGSSSNWVNYRDSGNNVAQEQAFIVRGTTGGGPAPCYPNCDGSTVPPVLGGNDFQCFLNRFAEGHTYANCDESSTQPVLSANDFQCFLNKYAAGCS